MTSVLYASILAFLIIWLSLNTIKKRQSNKVSIGDGNIEELKLAIATHSNAIENIPIGLLLLFTLEYNQANIYLVHLLGLCFTIGRILHAKGLLASNMAQRVVGMKITIFTIIGLAIINFVYLPYAKFML